MKKIVLTLITLSLIGCGDSSNGSSTGINDIGDTDNQALISECENAGCTLDSAITVATFTVSSAPITLTQNASITLE